MNHIYLFLLGGIILILIIYLLKCFYKQTETYKKAKKNIFLFTFKDEKEESHYKRVLLRYRNMVNYNKLLSSIKRKEFNKMGKDKWKDFENYFKTTYVYWRKKLDLAYIQLHNTCILKKTSCNANTSLFSDKINCAKKCQKITIPTSNYSFISKLKMVRRIENRILKTFGIQMKKYVK